MKEKKCFAVIPDVQLGRKWININWWDKVYFWFRGIPTKPPEAVVGVQIAERLRKVVAWLNGQNLEFIITVGDLTDSATEEQLQEVSEILSELKVPFVLPWGNHDIWPYEFGPDKKVLWEAIRPLHYREFEGYFQEWKSSSCFQDFKEQGSWLQNYAFTVNGVRFIVVDNNSRKHAPFGLPGQDGVARLYPESQEWLIKCVSDLQEGKIIILSHAPLKKGLLKKLARLSEKKIISIAGHTHKRGEWRGQNVARVITNALYHEPYILLVQIGEEGIRTDYHRI